uniref:SCP domain-containing protein n=1 Tax=Haemonchus contortus TaxID=6289 RepID=A0A7I4YT91_HAECO
MNTKLVTTCRWSGNGRTKLVARFHIAQKTSHGHGQSQDAIITLQAIILDGWYTRWEIHVQLTPTANALTAFAAKMRPFAYLQNTFLFQQLPLQQQQPPQRNQQQSLAGSCPELNNGMTDEARKMFVDKHNEYRSLIAKGQAKGKPGQFAPKAARMLKVNYDCNVEANAMEWAKDCTFGMNMAAMLKRWGNNMHMIPSKINNKTEAAATSVAAWFGDLQKYGVPDKNVFTMDIYTTLSKYSQLAWQSSNRIGYVVVPCWESWTVVVCEYNPGGDLPGEKIYHEGDPCRRDADCQCPGCICSRDEALCIAP